MVEEVQGHVLWYLVQTCSAVLLVRSSLTPPGGGALAWWLCSAEWQAKGDGRQKEMAQSGLYPSSMGQAIVSAWLQSQVHASGSSQLQPRGPGQAVQQSSSPQGTMMILILGQGRVRTKGLTAGSKTAKVDGEGRVQGC